MDDIVEEMPVVNALAAFIKYLDVRSRFPRLPPSPHNRTRAPRVRVVPPPPDVRAPRQLTSRIVPRRPFALPQPSRPRSSTTPRGGRKLHRSGRHPEDIYWSSNPKYVNKAKIVGRQSSAVDSTIYRKLREEKEAIARRQEERAERLRKMRDANATDDLENLEAKLMDVHRAYGEYRRFPEKRRFRRGACVRRRPRRRERRPRDHHRRMATIGSRRWDTR